MNFKEAYEALKQGAKIKRPHWRGFWMKEDNTITMHCKDGSVVPFLETDDIFVDFDNIVADDWELLPDCEVKDLNITTFTFGEALSNLKRGNKVTRKGWNGKDQFLFLIKGVELRDVLKYGYGEYEGEPMITGAIAIKTTSNQIQVGWLASQSDMLSEDWMVVD